MDSNIYEPTTSSVKEFTVLLQEKYGKNKNINYFLNDSIKTFNFCVKNKNINFQPISAFKEGKMFAHIALIIDKRLPKGEAFFGFLEIPEDVSVFNSLWDLLINESKKKGVSLLKGPINGSIWHQYRCVKETNGDDFFKSELFSPLYYYDFLISKKPTKEVLYYSASREPYDIIFQKISEDSYKKLKISGFSIQVKESVTLEELQILAKISKKVFQSSWGYTELNNYEFMELYSFEKLRRYLNTLYLLYKGETIIGFCSTSKEDDKTLILKTICILPEYQSLGLGNALAYKIHLDAKKYGFEKIIYALIRKGNSIKNFPKEKAVIFRRYAAFEFSV